MINLVDVAFFSFYDIQNDIINATVCDTGSNGVQVSLDFANTIISAFIPFITMTICSYKIGHELISKKLKLAKDKSSKKEINCMKVMLAMNGFFLFCNLPYCLEKLLFDALSLFNITSQRRTVHVGKLAQA